MNDLVVDASVAAKWFLTEEFNDEARALLTGRSQHRAPDFILVEFANTLAKRFKRGDINAAYARNACNELQSLLVFEETRRLVPAALEIAIEFDRSVYDSLYVALARMQRCQLVTADRRLYNALSSAFVDTMLWIGDVDLTSSARDST